MNADPRSPAPSPFTGRETELGVLIELHRQRRNVLMVGSPGVGKSALLQEVKVRLPLLIIPQTKEKALFKSLEDQLKDEQSPCTGPEVKRYLKRIESRGEPVAFDSVADTSKAVSQFMFEVSKLVPVWIVCRSDLPHEIGLISNRLSDYVRLSLLPLKLIEVRRLIARSVQQDELRRDALNHVSALYRLCRGNPKILTAMPCAEAPASLRCSLNSVSMRSTYLRYSYNSSRPLG
jgi:hypothetical protein